MDIDKILELQKNCLKLLDCVLAGEKNKISYAFEYILVLIGENIHSVIIEIENYLFSNETLFFKLLKKIDIEFDDERLRKDQEYRLQKFRTVFNKSNIGKNLSLLNFIRNEIKHHFIHLTEEDHDKFRVLYIYVQPIIKFIKELYPLIDKHKKDPAALIGDLFNNNEIKSLEASEIRAVVDILKKAKQMKIKKQTFEDQRQIVLQRIALILQIIVKLKGYSDRLKEVKKFKGHEIDLYATLMLITVIGENCIKLTAYRKKNSNFHEAIKKVLKDNNKLLASFGFLATEYTHQINELPNTRISQQTCERTMGLKNTFEELARAISDLKFPDVEMLESEEEEKAISEPKHQIGELEEKKEEATIPDFMDSIRQALLQSHTSHPKKEKLPKLPRNEIDDIFEKARKKRRKEEPSKKYEEPSKKKDESQKPGRKRTL